MASLNAVTLLGHLGKDPEVRFLESGKAVCRFPLATSEKWKAQDGSWQERTDWHQIVVWGAQGQACGEHLAKGSQVVVTGSVRYRKYADREGVERFITEVVASQVKFVGAKKSRAAEPAEAGPPVGDDLDDEIPF